MRFFLTALSLCGLTSGAVAQPMLQSAEPEQPAPEASATPSQALPDTPLIMRSAASKQAAQRKETADEVITRLRGELREIAQAIMTEAERKQALDELYRRNAKIFKIESTERDAGSPRTVDEAVLKLERLFFEIAIEAAPDDESREEIMTRLPSHVGLEPNRPILIAPRTSRSKIVITRQAEEEGIITPWWKTTKFDTEALALEEVRESPVEQLEPPEENVEEKVKVEVLSDEKVTVEMHDDATILRAVEADDGDLVLFDALHLWVGGAVQFDGYTYDDLLNARSGGGSENDTATRRAEVIIRSTLFDWGEVKAQYDFDAEFWRDLYYRNVNEAKGRTITIGNQTEPMAQENTLGNKFLSALERSGPTSVFGSFRGKGVRVNRWFEREVEQQIFDFHRGQVAYLTTTLGVFGEDIESTNDTDLALTGRITAGSETADGRGLHLGLSGTVRDGEFDRINPRPEIQEVDRIVLAEFEADQAAILGVEAMYALGSLHAEGQVYYADYRGGDVDATGYGGYAQAGYYLTGQTRGYRPKWGLWAPVQAGNSNVFEVFARVSYTYGDSDEAASNDLRSLTLGGSWYRHKYRVSFNAVYSETDNDIAGEDSGLGAAMRFQYLF